MYREFFGLSASPFNDTPDPRFFFNTPDLEKALTSLLNAVEERKGLVLVTGEAGTGKTLLSRLLLSRLPPGTPTSVITNTRLQGRELLPAICRGFQLDADGGSTSAGLSHSLETFLLEQYSRGRPAVLVLDEAQELPIESFEEIRMLGNLEADNAKLLQVLILGQPELQSKFQLPDMRRLHQRILRAFHLRALTEDLTNQYIAHRLQVAGAAQGDRLFDADAASEIHKHAGGVPRRINQICDNAMFAAFNDSRKTINAGHIREVVEQMMTMTLDPQEYGPRPDGAPESLLDAAIASTDDTETQTRELLEQARLSNQRARHQAAEILKQARSSAERFRRQAETLVQDAESTSDRVRKDILSLRDNVISETEQIREQITSAKRELAEASKESADRLQNARRAHADAQVRSEELLRQAEQAADESRNLLRMPNEILEEANRNAQSLSTMSKKVSKIVRQLSEITAKAERQRIELADASVSADEKLTHLKQQSQRVGQLVGIIRKLYGAMDVRVGRLRDGLKPVGERYRNAPSRIDEFRSVPAGESRRTFKSSESAARDAKSSRPPARRPVPVTPSTTSSTVQVPAVADEREPVDTLAHVVRRNQKLNQWLSETLAGASQPAPEKKR